MRKRASQSKPELIGEILRKVLKKRNIPHTATDRRLLDLWTRAVGPQIAARTLPETVKRGGLYVRVSAPAWLHQLQRRGQSSAIRSRPLVAARDASARGRAILSPGRTPHSSRGPGHRPLKAETTGSNPVCGTTSNDPDAPGPRPGGVPFP